MQDLFELRVLIHRGHVDYYVHEKLGSILVRVTGISPLSVNFFSENLPPHFSAFFVIPRGVHTLAGRHKHKLAVASNSLYTRAKHSRICELRLARQAFEARRSCKLCGSQKSQLTTVSQLA